MRRRRRRRAAAAAEGNTKDEVKNISADLEKRRFQSFKMDSREKKNPNQSTSARPWQRTGRYQSLSDPRPKKGTEDLPGAPENQENDQDLQSKKNFHLDQKDESCKSNDNKSDQGKKSYLSITDNIATSPESGMSHTQHREDSPTSFADNPRNVNLSPTTDPEKIEAYKSIKTFKKKRSPGGEQSKARDSSGECCSEERIEPSYSHSKQEDKYVCKRTPSTLSEQESSSSDLFQDTELSSIPQGLESQCGNEMAKIHLLHDEGHSLTSYHLKENVDQTHNGGTRQGKQRFTIDCDLPVIKKELKMHLRLSNVNTRNQTFQNSEDAIRETSSLHEGLNPLDSKKNLIRRPRKFTIHDVLVIRPVCIEKQALNEDIIWHFLQKLMALNASARNINVQESTEAGSRNVIDVADISVSASIHPLDIVCILLHSSDIFLQQEILSKMYLCQYAVPLLLPAGNGHNCTFMLWAMREIIIKWISCSKDLREDNLVNIKMPTISFVRLGESGFSKSTILNNLLSSSMSHFEMFVNCEMDGGDQPKTVANGLVEISWYFPGKQKNIYSEPFAVTNLHGDIRDHCKQFRFIAEVSSVVFLFIKDVTDADFNFLSSCKNTHFFVIVEESTKEKSKELLQNLEMLSKTINLKMYKISTNRNRELVKMVRSLTSDIVKTTDTKMCLVNMAPTAEYLDIEVDENNGPCQKAKKYAQSIIQHIESTLEYKSSTMKLQGALWKEISKIDKELCRQKYQGDTDDTDHKNQLVSKRLENHRAQYWQAVPQDINSFIKAMKELDMTEKRYFLKWMKTFLDSLARKNLSVLRTKFKQKQKESSAFDKGILYLSQEISDSSLGVEHFLRELAQYYEAECSLVNVQEVKVNQRKFTDLPGIAADLLLDGFPLELMDGDASNIPLQWITDVLTELDTKTGGQYRMRVITVLGVQSTGKSTLLNTMFGLQFPVASGRCTRGAFMTLLKVEKNFQEELGCEFILVIDTEGLKAPELSKLDDSYEHDNELATLVVGLSDVTIVNISMENTSDMNDTLTIVLHAFLRMNGVGKKPNCQFVHQNVSDVSTDDNTMIGRAQFLNELQEMIKVAAKMEKKDTNIQFSDILDYDPQKHSWYIPGLWHGVPPMASINVGYSETIYELKKYMFTFMTEKHHAGIHSIRSFTKWTNTLWQAIKYESFIFSFRNILAAEAYEKLCNKYSELEWEFRRQAYKLISKFENSIKNQSIKSNTSGQLEQTLNTSMDQILEQGEKNMSSQLSTFFKTGSNNPHLIERYKEEFFNSVKGLRRELQNQITSKFTETISAEKRKRNLKIILRQYLQNIDIQLNRYKAKLAGLRDVRELEEEFESIWQGIIGNLQPHTIEKLNVGNRMLKQLRDETRNRGSNVSGMLHNVGSLQQYEEKSFCVEDKHTDISILQKVVNLLKRNNAKDQLQNCASTIIDLCQDYVTEKVKTGEDYSDMYCRELLNMINGHLEKNSGKLSYNHLFQVELKLHILGRAAPQFQKMHDHYRVSNDPIYQIRALKPKYFNILKAKIIHTNETNIRAKYFCEQGLIPAITAYIYNNLGRQIIDDILKDADGAIFKSRKSFHYHLLAEMLDIDSFERYTMYINNYKTYINRWIYIYILQKYQSTDTLSKLIDKNLKSILKKIRCAIGDTQAQPFDKMSEFLKYFSMVLKQDLVIPRIEMEMTAFQNKANMSQFWRDIESFLFEINNQIRASLKTKSVTFLLCNLSLQPQTALASKVIGCEQECPFCHVPCEAESVNHRKHFATCHRPKGMAQYTWSETNTLCTSICTNDVISDDCFANLNTNGEWVPYKNYQTVYPEWIIETEEKNNSSNYWKFIFTCFNLEFAKLYDVEPAEIPEEWYRITKKHALRSLKAAYNIG
ncbi:interferon-induced very large GTPase 1-like isoform X1 [Dendrobates tinctorius]|uniref:interferon-induced very large GTPase 1-like isoform X1 n=2 Tax=Dendrobates tinctorius TaxID=92724 RepID=UPI003CC9C158